MHANASFVGHCGQKLGNRTQCVVTSRCIVRVTATHNTWLSIDRRRFAPGNDIHWIVENTPYPGQRTLDESVFVRVVGRRQMLYRRSLDSMNKSYKRLIVNALGPRFYGFLPASK